MSMNQITLHPPAPSVPLPPQQAPSTQPQPTHNDHNDPQARRAALQHAPNSIRIPPQPQPPSPCSPKPPSFQTSCGDPSSSSTNFLLSGLSRSPWPSRERKLVTRRAEEDVEEDAAAEGGAEAAAEAAEDGEEAGGDAG
ncbi:hypothetical protein CCMA1212_003468 [Trichoderma ghanense]|uniref:Uncharacterized protein n=1 Tax=Trichoderma ghanense TaxID=65468 RepID=A0ABY2H9T9_9HYPO